MNTRPIIFNGDMARALLDGRKTQTRRVVKPQPKWNIKEPTQIAKINPGFVDGRGRGYKSPYGQSGDLLWVREAFLPDPNCDHDAWDHHYCSFYEWNGCGSAIQDVPPTLQTPEHCIYRASWNYSDLVWRPSIHMPRWASRITLRITDVRVQRVQEITDSDAFDEGIDVGEALSMGCTHDAARAIFGELWDSINASRGYSWESNPWVWALTFDVIHQNVDQVLQKMEAA